MSQEIPENGGDIAHLNTIHAASLIAGSNLHNLETAAAKSARHVWEASWEPHRAPEGHVATMRLRHDLRILDRLPLPLIGMDVEAKQVRISVVHYLQQVGNDHFNFARLLIPEL